VAISVLPLEFVDREVEAICERYKISPSLAREVVEGCFAERPKLVARIEQEYGSQDVTRWKDYRKTVKEVRKRVYYQLRRYHADREEEAKLREELEACISSSDITRASRLAEALTQLHVSARERLPFLADFYEVIFAEIGYPESVLDVGCGYHPLTYPFRETTRRYVALEKDAETCETLRVFSPMAMPAELVPVCGHCGEVDIDSFLADDETAFDVAFLFKLVPVVARSEPGALQALANLPTEMFVVTASKEAMTRSQDVSRREDRALLAFIELTGRSNVSRFEIGNELGYFVR